MELTDMAKAHLSNIQNAIVDLYKQREKIEEEITKLTSYLKEGEALVSQSQTVAENADVTDVYK